MINMKSLIQDFINLSDDVDFQLFDGEVIE